MIDAIKWFTKCKANPAALEVPTSSAPINPGPAVTAKASISLIETLASAKACRITLGIASKCARLAISGTTPPNLACSSTLDEITFANNFAQKLFQLPSHHKKFQFQELRRQHVFIAAPFA